MEEYHTGVSTLFTVSLLVLLTNSWRKLCTLDRFKKANSINKECCHATLKESKLKDIHAN